MKLSKNLTLAELVRSESAKRLGIDNTPDSDQIESLKALTENIFQPIRDEFKKPIYISSGFRCVELNRRVGGSNGSQHTKGQAIDIDMDGTSISNAEIFKFIKDNLDFDQLIWEFGDDESPAWVHVSYISESENRGRIFKAEKVNNKTIYSHYVEPEHGENPAKL